MRGEPTHNLEAFRGWLERDESAAGEDEHEGDQGR